jgi:3-deoxy-D-manno-octulosonic acid kinase
MTDLQTLTSKGQTIWFDPHSVEQISPLYFEPEYWQAQNALTGQAQGRGTTYFIEYQHQAWVLRHYKRGGLIGKLLNDQYLYSTLHNTRVWQELQLLRHMLTQNLPVPTPIAGRVEVNFAYYRGDLITAKIPQARDLHQLLLQAPLAPHIWTEIGKTIARFHQQQVFHHDLNIHNIMLDAKHKVWLIDFDKCGLRSGDEWKAANLARLNRSLQKESRLHQPYHFVETDMDNLLAGYHDQRSAGPN